jgi:hypothetical protein
MSYNQLTGSRKMVEITFFSKTNPKTIALISLLVIAISATIGFYGVPKFINGTLKVKI